MTVETFTSGSGTFTVPSGVYVLTRRARGPGGGGGAGISDTGPGAGTGGGGGGYCEDTIAVVPGDTVPWSVGSRGVGGTVGNDDATAGGVTTCGPLTANGGGRGRGLASSVVGAGGTASGGITNLTGSDGSPRASNNTGGNGGQGANSGGLGGAGGATSGVDGAAGSDYGGGGGGGGKSANGGLGGRGYVEFEYEALAESGIVASALGPVTATITAETTRAAIVALSLSGILLDTTTERTAAGVCGVTLQSVVVTSAGARVLDRQGAVSQTIGMVSSQASAAGSVTATCTATLDHITSSQNAVVVATLGAIVIGATSIDGIVGEADITIGTVSTALAGIIEQCDLNVTLGYIALDCIAYRFLGGDEILGAVEATALQPIESFGEGASGANLVGHVRAALNVIAFVADSESVEPSGPLAERTGYLI